MKGVHPDLRLALAFPEGWDVQNSASQVAAKAPERDNYVILQLVQNAQWTRLYFARRLTEKFGGAKIYLKREDLNHTGAHKINNTIGQALLTRRLDELAHFDGLVLRRNGLATHLGLLDQHLAAHGLVFGRHRHAPRRGWLIDFAAGYVAVFGRRFDQAHDVAGQVVDFLDQAAAALEGAEALESMHDRGRAGPPQGRVRGAP